MARSIDDVYDLVVDLGRQLAVLVEHVKASDKTQADQAEEIKALKDRWVPTAPTLLSTLAVVVAGVALVWDVMIR